MITEIPEWWFKKEAAANRSQAKLKKVHSYLFGKNSSDKRMFKVYHALRERGNLDSPTVTEDDIRFYIKVSDNIQARLKLESQQTS